MKYYMILVVLLWAVSTPYFFPIKEHHAGSEEYKKDFGKFAVDKAWGSVQGLNPAWGPRDPRGATEYGLFTHIGPHLIVLITNITAAVYDTGTLYNKIATFPEKIEEVAYSNNDVRNDPSDLARHY
jgi:hypothetical protein